MINAESLVSADRQRRMHKKSRNGCVQCRKRHVKCDEQRPLCGRCVKTAQKCSLSLPAPSEHSCSSQRPILPSNAPPLSQQMAVNDITPRDLRVRPEQKDQMQLSFRYSSFTCSPRYQPLPTGDMELLHSSIREGETFGLDADDDIRLGFSSPYLLHIILSLSALRMYDRQPTRLDLLARASRHQNHALILVHPHLASLNHQNVHAVLRFAFLVSIIALGQPLYQSNNAKPQQTQDPIDDLLHSFAMVRGVKFVTERRWQLSGEAFPLPAGGAGPRLDDEDPFCQDLPVKFPQYRALRTLITRTCTISSERLVCLDALRKVFSFTALIESHPDLHPHARMIQIWPLELDARFMAMLAARRPIALLILGCYTALLKLRAGGAWPFEAWPGLVLRKVVETLGKEWARHLGWAVGRVLGDGGRFAGGGGGGGGGGDFDHDDSGGVREDYSYL